MRSVTFDLFIDEIFDLLLDKYIHLYTFNGLQILNSLSLYNRPGYFLSWE